MSLFKSQYELKISFEDLDPMNVVWHGNYIRYMEQARCDMFSKLNYTYQDMKKDGVAYPVAKLTTKYIKPAEFEDVLVVEIEIKELEPALIINYTIFNKKTGERIFKAQTMQIAVEIKSGKTLYIAPNYLKNKLIRG